MRGRHEEQEVMLVHVDIEERVPKDHVSRPSSTGCTPGWAGPQCHRSDC